jgi:hypothetical protein
MMIALCCAALPFSFPARLRRLSTVDTPILVCVCMYRTTGICFGKMHLRYLRAAAAARTLRALDRTSRPWNCSAGPTYIQSPCCCASLLLSTITELARAALISAQATLLPCLSASLARSHEQVRGVAESYEWRGGFRP